MEFKLGFFLVVLQLHVAVSYKSCKLLLLLLLCGQSSCDRKVENTHKNNVCLLPSDKINKLCSSSKFKALLDVILDDKPNVELEKSDHLSAALISHHWNDQTYKSVEYCDFMVITKTYRNEPLRGIFASIRSMNLRRKSPNECIDYVTFEVGSGALQRSQKMCGTIDGDEVYDLTNFFDAPGGTIKVTIFINRYVTLEAGKELNIELSFTSYDGNTDGQYSSRNQIIKFEFPIPFHRLQQIRIGMSIEKVHCQRLRSR